VPQPITLTLPLQVELDYGASIYNLTLPLTLQVELDYGASIYNLSGYHYDSDANLLGGDHLINDTRGYSGIVHPVSATIKDIRCVDRFDDRF
jgi:hypothetical protein